MELITSEILDLWGSCFFFSITLKISSRLKNFKRNKGKILSVFRIFDLKWWREILSITMRIVVVPSQRVIKQSYNLSSVFLTQFGSEWRKSWIKVLFCRFQEFFGLVNAFTAKGFSDKSPLMHVNKHIFWSQ